jgi:hypothetical protein
MLASSSKSNQRESLTWRLWDWCTSRRAHSTQDLNNPSQNGLLSQLLPWLDQGLPFNQGFQKWWACSSSCVQRVLNQDTYGIGSTQSSLWDTWWCVQPA